MDTPDTRALDEMLTRFPEEQRPAVRAACFSERYGLNDNLVDYFSRVQLQPIITATSFEELPGTLLRKCCQYKSCGSTELALQITPHFEHVEGDLYRRVVSGAVYARTSNDEGFWWASTIEEMLEKVNDPTWYPLEGDV